jgi:hypothetical protein
VPEVGNLLVRLQAESSKFRSEFEASQKRVDQLEKKVRSGSKNMQGDLSAMDSVATKLTGAFVALGASLSVRAIVSAASEWVHLYEAQAQAEAGLRTVLVSMGRYNQSVEGQIKNTASLIQSYSNFGDEAVIEGGKILSTFSKIGNDLMPQTLKTTADLAAFMKTDFVSAANIMGKAAEGQTGQLSRYGISLSETAKKSKDYSLILKEIAQQVGGQAKAMRDASAGTEALGNTIGDTKEKLGELVTAGIKPATEEFNKLFTEINNEDWSEIKTSIGDVGKLIATLIRTAKEGAPYLKLTLATGLLANPGQLKNSMRLIESAFKDLDLLKKAESGLVEPISEEQHQKNLKAVRDRIESLASEKAHIQELGDAWKEVQSTVHEAVVSMVYEIRQLPTDEAAGAMTAFVEGFQDMGEVTKGINDFNKIVDDRFRALLNTTESTTVEMGNAWNGLAQDMNSSFLDFLDNAEGGLGNLLDFTKNWAVKMVHQIEAAFLTQNIGMPIMASLGLAGDWAPSSGGGFFNSPLVSGVTGSSWWNTPAWTSALPNNTYDALTGLPTGLQGDLFGPSWGGLLSGAGMGFGAGSLLSGIMGTSGIGSTIGSGVGSIGGALLGSIIPGVGTVIGGLLGGLLGGAGGGLFSSKPEAGNIEAEVLSGPMSVETLATKRHFKQTGSEGWSRDVVEQFEQSVVGTLDLLEKGMSVGMDDVWTKLAGFSDKIFDVNTVQEAVNKFLTDFLAEADRQIPGLFKDSKLKDMYEAGASVEDMTSFITTISTALSSFDAYRNMGIQGPNSIWHVDTFSQAVGKIDTQLGFLEDNLNDLAGMDYADAVGNISTLLQQRYEMEVTYLTHLKGLQSDLISSVTGLETSFMLDTLDTSGQQQYWYDQTNSLFGQIQDATDPDKLAGFVTDWVSGMGQIWGLLSPDQQQGWYADLQTSGVWDTVSSQVADVIGGTITDVLAGHQQTVDLVDALGIDKQAFGDAVSGAESGLTAVGNQAENTRKQLEALGAQADITTQKLNNVPASVYAPAVSVEFINSEVGA